MSIPELKDRVYHIYYRRKYQEGDELTLLEGNFRFKGCAIWHKNQAFEQDIAEGLGGSCVYHILFSHKGTEPPKVIGTEGVNNDD